MTGKTLRYALAIPLTMSGFALAATGDRSEQPGAMPSMTHSDQQTSLAFSRASKLIGASVTSSDDQSIGKVSDVVLNSSQQRIGFAIILCSGSDGMSNKFTAIPYQVLQVNDLDNSKVRLTITAKAVQSAPMLAITSWPGQASEAYYTQADDYYRQQVKDSGLEAITASARLTPGETWSQRGSEWVGRTVQNQAGENLGTLNDIVVDSRTGNVRYAVLGVGGVMGVGEKLFAVPITQFKAQTGQKHLTLNASKDQLKNATGFDKDHWPAMAEPQWIR